MKPREQRAVVKASSLPIEVDFREAMPLTEQIRGQIRALIARGALQPGAQLPTVRQLAADLRVNFNTVARAYRMLEKDGLISVQHGRGTFVLAPLSEENKAALKQEALRALARQVVRQARALGLREHEVIAALRRAWQEDEPP